MTLTGTRSLNILNQAATASAFGGKPAGIVNAILLYGNKNYKLFIKFFKEHDFTCKIWVDSTNRVHIKSFG